ncbi:NADH oxidase, partial [Klebsiella pneumoniae]
MKVLSDSAIERVVALGEPLGFLRGQCVSSQVRGTTIVSAYSVSAEPGCVGGRFVIRN